MDDILSKLDRLDDIVDEMDFDYSVGEVHIDTMEQFREKLLEPAQDRSVKRFYRGERISSLKRPLLPTMFRDREALIGESSYADIDAAYILKHYRETPFYFDLYTSTFGQARKYCMYDLCAFSQHYLNWSPFIDFSKSLFVALSFGLKAKSSFENEGVLYVVEISDEENYTTDRVTAECWLNDYHVRVCNYGKGSDIPKDIEYVSPNARVIDIATNDRMKFQQGVFLLLDQFTLVNHLYLTKNVRDSVRITKYILGCEVCPEMTALVEREAPWYSFHNLLDVGAGIQTALKFERTVL